MAPTLLLYALRKLNARNMLRSGVLQELRCAEPEVRLVIVSPLAEDPAFVAELADAQTAVEHAPVYELSPLQARLTSLAIERFVRQHPTRATEIRWQRQENVGSGSFRALAQRAKATLSQLPLPPAPLLEAAFALTPRRAYETLMRKHQPDLVAIGTGWQIYEMPWKVAARRFRVPSISIDVNWDAFESKPGIIYGSDELVVWSERMKQKSVSRFGYAPERVHVTGAPHLDRYFRQEGIRPREAFLAALGFETDARLVTLAAILPHSSPHDPARVELLYEALQRGELGPRTRLLVRLHPVDSMDRWRRFEGWPNLRVETAYGHGPGGGSYERGESPHDMRHQVETLLYTDVLVNVNSTISLEAMLVDTPVVMVAFDGRGGKLPYLESDARFLDYEHIRSLLETGGVRVADTPEDLLQLIRRYLDEPGLDRAERAHAADTLYGPRDGRSARRVAERMLELARRGA